ncbi:GNAT family N-acetyltransferase [Prauserella cavernicola]|uniref:GNAT family N-acetyltransferase n=1 Tax=Prauserella cavernicola TaxID=2800127 RepID=A0A934V6X6_9PSEU|nr:GNAT family protein [Prauserella cavernicola]MBK1787992.1 GNAT family N-acetyltransferase [Prauserella cavernicola]
MTSTMSRLLPSELVVREISERDQDIVDEFLSAERISSMSDSGFTEADDETRQHVISYISAGIARGWFVELPGHGPLCLQLYMPFGVPGVWSGDVINGPGASGVGRPGVGTACMAAVLDALFAGDDVHRLMGFVSVTNVPSLRMCDRLGFTREGLVREQMPSPDGRVDAVVMGLLSREWRGAAAIEEQLVR